MQLRSAARTALRESAAAIVPVVDREDDRLATAMALHDAIACLPESLRRAFVLCDVEGFSHAEVAALLDITVTASRARRHRAVGLLQSILRSSR